MSMCHNKLVCIQKSKYCYNMYRKDGYIGRCHFYCDAHNFDITKLYIEKRFRSNGYGTILVYEVLRDAYNNGHTHVELSDASARYRQKQNIYTLMGFSYTNYDNAMKGNIRHILYGKPKRIMSYMNKYRIVCVNE